MKEEGCAKGRRERGRRKERRKRIKAQKQRSSHVEASWDNDWPLEINEMSPSALLANEQRATRPGEMLSQLLAAQK